MTTQSSAIEVHTPPVSERAMRHMQKAGAAVLLMGALGSVAPAAHATDLGVAIAVGTVVGAVLGGAVDGGDGALVGGVIGATIGATAGSYSPRPVYYTSPYVEYGPPLPYYYSPAPVYYYPPVRHYEPHRPHRHRHGYR